MSSDPQKSPASDTDLNDSLGIVFNDSIHQDKAEYIETPPVTAATDTSLHYANKQVKTFEEDSLEAGTIVSDRRQDRPTLAHNLKSAFSEWQTNAKKSLETGFDSALTLLNRKERAEINIPKAETRAETIKEASVYTAQVPQDDHTYVRERIVTENKEGTLRKSDPIHIKDAPQKQKENENESAWAHTIDESEIVAPVLHTTLIEKEIPERNIPVSQIVHNVPKEEVHVSHTEVPLRSLPPTPPKEEVIPVKPTFNTPKEVVTPRLSPSQTEPVSGTASTFPGTATQFPTKQNFASVQNLSSLTSSDTDVSQNNTIRRILKWIILFCIALLGAGLAFYASTHFNIFEESIPTPVEEGVGEETFIIIPKIFETDTQNTITLPLDKSVFLADLNSKIQRAPLGVSQFYPVVLSGSERRAATTEEIVAILNLHLSNTTIRSLAAIMMLGSVNTSRNEPFIVLQSSRFDILFSGLLEWEHYLQSDLNPLFGSIISSEKFTDATIANRPVRILKDAEGNEILLYAFVDQTTVIITASRAALSKIFESIQ
ncbi:MAG: hypothetical protein WAW13_03270 [Minisyncoccia bacterium]